MIAMIVERFFTPTELRDIADLVESPDQTPLGRFLRDGAKDIRDIADLVELYGVAIARRQPVQINYLLRVVPNS